MAIKRNITDISALKRGANNLTAVYRGTTLIWPTTPPPTVRGYVINALDTSINKSNPADGYVVNGLNTLFK